MAKYNYKRQKLMEKNYLTLLDKKFLMSCFIVKPIDWLPKFKPINMSNSLYVILSPF